MGKGTKVKYTPYHNIPTPFERNLRLQEDVINSDSLDVYRPHKPKGQRREKVSITRLKMIMIQCNYLHRIYKGFWEYKIHSSNNTFYIKMKHII